MSPRNTRRALLRATGIAAVAGLAGCGASDSDSTGTPTWPRTYGIEVDNQMTAEDFERSDRLEEPKPAVMSLTVRDLDPDSDKEYLDRTVEVPLEETRTIEDVFTAKRDGTTYAMSAEAEPYSQQDARNPDNLNDSITFTPADGSAPSVNPIPVVVRVLDSPQMAEVTIHQELPVE